MFQQKINVSISLIFFSSLLIWLSCGNPSKPYYGNPPELANKTIQKTSPLVIGATYKMYITHTGTAPFTYKWFKNDTLLASSVTDTCRFDTLMLADSGFYQCIVANDWGSDTTLKDTLRLSNHAPYITIDTLTSGDTLSLTEMDSLAFTVGTGDSDLTDTPVLLPPLNLPTGSVFDSATGSFSYIAPFSLTTGTAPYVWSNVTFIVTDNVNSLGIDSFVIHLVVKDSNSAPVWAIDSVELTVTEGDSLFYDIGSVFLGDNEGEVVTFSKTFGAFSSDTSGWYWKPGFSHSGDTACVVSATDNHVPPATATLKLKISVADSTPAVTLSPPSNVTYKSATLSWTQSVEPAFGAYKLYYSTSPGVTEGSTLAETIDDIFTTSATIDSLTENVHYYFKVFSYNSNLVSSGSNEVDTTIPVLSAPIIMISSPQITRDSGFVREATPTLVGSNATAAGIQSMTATINNGPITVNLTDNDWTIDIATVAQKKQWNELVINSVDVTGKSGDTTVYVYYMPTLPAPQEPVYTIITNRSLRISWNSIAYCSNYILHRSDVSATGPFQFVGDLTDTTVVDTPLHVGTRYWYNLQGYYTASGGHGMSDSTDLSTASDTVTKNWFVEYFKGTDRATGYKVLQTSDGGFIIGGSTNTSALDNNEVYVVRTNKSGDTLWTRTHGGANADECFDMTAAAGGGYVLAGYTKSFTPDNNEDVYLVKIDDNGNKLWEKNWGWPRNDRAYGIVELSDGSFGITGYGYDTSVTDSSMDVLLMQCDASGDTLWTALWGDTAIQVGYDIQVSSGDLVVVGQTGSFIGNQSDVLIVRRSSSGSISDMPLNVSSTAANDIGVSLIVESDGLIVSGHAEGTFLFGTSKAMLCKINSIGFTDWVTIFDGQQGAVGRDVKKTLDGGYIVAGVANQHNLMPQNFECYLVKTDAGGTVVQGFDHTWGSSFNDLLNSVVPTSDGGYVIAGYSNVNDSKSNVYFIKTNSEGKLE